MVKRSLSSIVIVLFLIFIAAYLSGCGDPSRTIEREKAEMRVREFVKSDREQVKLTDIYNDKRWTFACGLGPYEILDQEIGAGFYEEDKLPWTLEDFEWGVAFFDNRKKLVFYFTVSRQLIELKHAVDKCVSRDGAVLLVSNKNEINLAYEDE